MRSPLSTNRMKAFGPGFRLQGYRPVRRKAGRAGNHL